MELLGVAGSLRRDSHNRSLLRAAAALLPPEVGLTTYEGLKEIPPFDEDDENNSRARGRAVAWGDRAGRRGPVRDARIQLVDPGAAEKRARLGITAGH